MPVPLYTPQARASAILPLTISCDNPVVSTHRGSPHPGHAVQIEGHVDSHHR